MLPTSLTLNIAIATHTSVYCDCCLQYPPRVQIGDSTVINRDVLLDGRMGLVVDDNVSISEGVAIFTLEHDPNSPTFKSRGAAVWVADYAFLGARTILLPGVTGRARSDCDSGRCRAPRCRIIHHRAGIPARPIRERSHDVGYKLDYRKFLG